MFPGLLDERLETYRLAGSLVPSTTTFSTAGRSTDTIVDLGGRDELANYGEYSGDPNAELTYQYAKTILDLLTRQPDPKGRPKILIIGGGIANFVVVAVGRFLEDEPEHTPHWL